MREMKDSGITFVGNIPDNWKVLKNKRCFELEKDIVGPKFKEYQLLSLTKRGVILKDINNTYGKTPESYETYQSVKKGQLIMCLFDLDISAVFSGITDYNGMISPAYKIYNCKNNIYNRYAGYWFDFCFDGRKYMSFSKSLRYVVNTDDFKDIEIIVPPLKQQYKIVQFLDKKITEIDNVIKKTKQTIEDYKLYKQSIITKAVTKGLDETVEMKDSGIEWIGRIPKHWNLKKLKFSSKTRNEKYNKRFGNLEYFALENIASGDAEFVKTNNQYSLDGTMICEKDDVVFGKLRPYLAKVYKSPKRQCCSSEFAIFYDFEGISDYYKYLFLTHWFINVVDASTYGTKMPRANIEYLNNMIIPIPNIEEQIEIVKYIENKIIEINKLIKNKEKLIIELEKYEKSIIYEYVTGKKEVREKKFNNTDNINGIKINCKDNIFAQAILLCKIIEKLRNYNLGRVKAEKTLYLIEKEVGFDFNNKYVREAAGPLSENIYKCESIISKKNKWVNIKKVKKHIEYETLPNFHKYSQYYDKYFSSYDNQIENIIDIIRNYSTDKAEMVATLYAAWNDFIIKKDKVSDKEIVKDVRENWNDRKKRFNEREWLEVLEEMKQNGLTPKGNGNLTIIKE